MNPFVDQKVFMDACWQTTDRLNHDQLALYHRLTIEELLEFDDAFLELEARRNGGGRLEQFAHMDDAEVLAEVIDGATDMIVVLIGALHSIGAGVASSAWAEVNGSNMSKIDPVSGRVIKREDGKVLKPEGFRRPNLKPIALRALENKQ